jgi:hypothetical protein
MPESGSEGRGFESLSRYHRLCGLRGRPRGRSISGGQQRLPPRSARPARAAARAPRSSSPVARLRGGAFFIFVAVAEPTLPGPLPRPSVERAEAFDLPRSGPFRRVNEAVVDVVPHPGSLSKPDRMRFVIRETKRAKVLAKCASSPVVGAVRLEDPLVGVGVLAYESVVSCVDISGYHPADAGYRRQRGSPSLRRPGLGA